MAIRITIAIGRPIRTRVPPIANRRKVRSPIAMRTRTSRRARSPTSNCHRRHGRLTAFSCKLPPASDLLDESFCRRFCFVGCRAVKMPADGPNTFIPVRGYLRSVLRLASGLPPTSTRWKDNDLALAKLRLVQLPSPRSGYRRVLQRICYLLHRSGCFRPSDRLAGWDSHPREIADFTAYWFRLTSETFDLIGPSGDRVVAAVLPLQRLRDADKTLATCSDRLADCYSISTQSKRIVPLLTRSSIRLAPCTAFTASHFTSVQVLSFSVISSF